MNRTGTAIGVAIVVVVAAVVVLGGITRRSATTSALSVAPTVGHLAPGFRLPNTSGRQVSLADYRGRVVLLNFFATWCIPCGREMPALARLQQQHRGFQVLAIDKQEPASDVRQFATSHHLTFDPLLDAGGSVWQRYGVNLQPVSFWIDRQGVVRAISYGAMPDGHAARELKLLSRG